MKKGNKKKGTTMNFCGTKINTTPPTEKKSKKTEKLLAIQPGMWKCEKDAIQKHNAKIELQNKGASPATLKTIDMSFLGKIDENKNPVFGVFPTTSFKCTLEIGLNRGGKFSSINCHGLPKMIGAGYRTGLKGKTLKSTGYRRYKLTANFVGMLPQKTKDKIVAFKEAGIATFLVADTHWKTTKVPTKAPNPDPLLIAVFEGQVYLVDVFDASIEENYVAREFTTDPERTE